MPPHRKNRRLLLATVLLAAAACRDREPIGEEVTPSRSAPKGFEHIDTALPLGQKAAAKIDGDAGGPDDAPKDDAHAHAEFLAALPYLGRAETGSRSQTTEAENFYYCYPKAMAKALDTVAKNLVEKNWKVTKTAHSGLIGRRPPWLIRLSSSIEKSPRCRSNETTLQLHVGKVNPEFSHEE